MIRHYVKILYHGFKPVDEEVKEIVSRELFDIKTIPKDAYGYQFYDITEIIIDDDSGTVLTSKPFNVSNRYLFGKKLSLEYVKEHMPGETTLILNMEGNKWTHVLQVKSGACYILEDDDVVIPEP